MSDIDIRKGDCFNLLKSLKDKSVDLVITDAPYLFDNGNWLTSKVVGKKSILGRCDKFRTDEQGKIYNDMSSFGEKEITEYLSILLPKMKVANMYIFCNSTQIPFYGMFARNNNLHFDVLVWEKPLSVINKNRFSTHIEYICRIYDFGTSLNKLTNSNFYSKVIRVRKEDLSFHPTQKPISILQRLILLSSNENDTILDCFMGSGSVGVACIRTNRNFIGFEIDEKIFRTAEKRIESEKKKLRLF